MSRLQMIENSWHRWWNTIMLLMLICFVVSFGLIPAQAGHHQLDHINFPACEGNESGEWYTQSFLQRDNKQVVTYLFVVEPGFSVPHPDVNMVICMVMPDTQILILRGGKDA